MELWNRQWEPPEIRTRFVKDRLKRVRRGNLSWEEIRRALSSVSSGPKKYAQDDFRYVAELIHLERMLYVELHAGPDARLGFAFNMAKHYLTNKYPWETAAILDELDPEHSHVEVARKIEFEKKRKRQMEPLYTRRANRAVQEWWRLNVGTE